MIDTLKIFEDLKQTLEPSAAKKIAEVLGTIYEELRNTVTKEDFKELKDIVSELTQAQKNSEARLTKLEEVVKELAEAQKRTEQRMDELAEAQRETQKEVSRLDKALSELAEAQKRTEERLESFEKTTQENFKKVWASINELAEAQKRTEKEVKELAEALKDTKKMVGGLSDAVGYGLEDRAIKNLPELLKKQYNITITEGLVRRFLKYNGRQDEVNIFGTGKKANKPITILGEAKARLSKKHIDKFLELIERLKKAGIIHKEVFPLIVTYSAEPEVEDFARENGINVIWSFQI